MLNVISVKRSYIFQIFESTIIQKHHLITQLSKNTPSVSKGLSKVWKGPSDGLSQSLINKFLECPFRFYLYSILGVEEDRLPNLNLIWGNAFHKGLEVIFKYYELHGLHADEKLPPDLIELLYKEVTDDISKMCQETPVPRTVPYSIIEMLKLYKLPRETGLIEAEQVFTYDYTLPSGRDVKFRGKADGVGPTQLVEHKCKGKIDSIQTMKETSQDLQVNLYSWVFDRRNIVYDIIRIPEAQYQFPAPRNDELSSAFCYRIFNNHNAKNLPIKRFQKYWIDQIELKLHQDEIERYVRTTIIPLCERIYDWYEYVTQPGFDIENPIWYNSLFYRTPIRHFDPGKTEYYKCNYWDYLVGDQDLECMKKVNSYYTELEQE